MERFQVGHSRRTQSLRGKRAIIRYNSTRSSNRYSSSNGWRRVQRPPAGIEKGPIKQNLHQNFRRNIDIPETIRCPPHPPHPPPFLCPLTIKHRQQAVWGMTSLIVTFWRRFGLMGVLAPLRSPAREASSPLNTVNKSSGGCSLAGFPNLFLEDSTPIKPKRPRNVTIKDTIPQPPPHRFGF